MGQSERGRESFIILGAKEEAAVVEASVTTTTHIYLLVWFRLWSTNPRNSSLSDKRINANSNQFVRLSTAQDSVRVIILCVHVCVCVSSYKQSPTRGPRSCNVYNIVFFRETQPAVGSQ